MSSFLIGSASASNPSISAGSMVETAAGAAAFFAGGPVLASGAALDGAASSAEVGFAPSGFGEGEGDGVGVGESSLS